MQIQQRDSKLAVELLYDSACPICDQFACSIDNSASNLKLIDARTKPELLRQAQLRNLNIDKTVIIYVKGEFVIGADAVHYIANNCRANGFVGFLKRYLFRHHFVIKVSYPFIALSRRFLLKYLNLPLINSQQDNK